MDAKPIMLQGTASNVGKSILTAALCRIFLQDGYRTAPFKAQNMALNSAVTPDGGEIGRAQAVQAEAAGIQATVEMNPILIKPKQDMHAQIVVLGRPYSDMSAKDYRSQFLPQIHNVVEDCIQKLKSEFDVLVIEGAGSPAEVNLKDRDIVNMKTAEMADSPVILVADIDRGGVFAAIIGTLELLEQHERERVKGFIINKFRGDLDLLQPGLQFLEQRTGIDVLGVIPYIHDHGIEEEDSVWLSEINREGRVGDKHAAIMVAVIQLPRISNFTDFMPFFGLPDVVVQFVKAGQPIGDVDLIILPGTKNTVLDMAYLWEQGYGEEIQAHVRRGKRLVGICGGYQMLGEELHDPCDCESDSGKRQPGLGLFPFTTEFHPKKHTYQVEARLSGHYGFWQQLQGEVIRGYEIHTGECTRNDKLDSAQGHSLLTIEKRSGKSVSVDDGLCGYAGRVFGTHVHGFFDNPQVLQAFINDIRREKLLPELEMSQLGIVEKNSRFDHLADIVRSSLDMEKVYQIMGLKVR